MNRKPTSKPTERSPSGKKSVQQPSTPQSTRPPATSQNTSADSPHARVPELFALINPGASIDEEIIDPANPNLRNEP